MLLESRRRMLLGTLLVALAAGAAGCDSPTAEVPGTSGAAPRRLIAGATTSAVLDTAAAPGVEKDTFRFSMPNVTTGHPGYGNIRIPLPGQDTMTVRTLGEGSTKTGVVNGDTITVQIGIWQQGSPTSGEFIGIIWKNGQFAGFWGHCALVVNHAFTTRDPETGRVWIHWLNAPEGSTVWTHHYIFDPQRNLLKIYRRKPDGTVVFVYMGPPVKKTSNLPPPDPPTSKGGLPWTSEEEIAAAAAGTGTSGTSTGTTGTSGTGTTGGTSTAPAGALD